ncbi:MAG: hypothetical protein MI919_05855 [Holophagales bacterium]|nr:hypothetical protein [Holophagales bacterium]
MSIQRSLSIAAILCLVLLAGTTFASEGPGEGADSRAPEIQATLMAANGAMSSPSLALPADCEAASETPVLPAAPLAEELDLAESHAANHHCGGWTFHFCCSSGTKKFQSRQCSFPGEQPWTEYKCSGVCPM